MKRTHMNNTFLTDALERQLIQEAMANQPNEALGRALRSLGRWLVTRFKRTQTDADAAPVAPLNEATSSAH